MSDLTGPPPAGAPAPPSSSPMEGVAMDVTMDAAAARKADEKIVPVEVFLNLRFLPIMDKDTNAPVVVMVRDLEDNASEPVTKKSRSNETSSEEMASGNSEEVIKECDQRVVINMPLEMMRTVCQITNDMLADFPLDQHVEQTIPLYDQVCKMDLHHMECYWRLTQQHGCIVFPSSHRYNFKMPQWAVDWVSQFVTDNIEQLYSLLTATNYVNYHELKELCAFRFARMIDGKEPDQIRAILKIKDDLTPEEKEMILAENGWMDHLLPRTGYTPPSSSVNGEDASVTNTSSTD